MPRRPFYYWLPVLLMAVGTASAAQKPPSSPSLLTGQALDEQLQAITSVTWSNTPISRALASLSQAQHISIVLDRRVDPDRSLRLALPREPLADILRKIAAQSGLGYCQLGPVAYFGPVEAAQRLRTLAALRTQEAQSLPANVTKKLLERRATTWDELAEPRQILEQWAADAEVALVGQNLIPHDLWPAAKLPPMSWIDRATLLTSQFGLTFRMDPDGRKITLMPVPHKVTLVRNYRARGRAEATAARWGAEMPTAVIAAAGDEVRVEGLLEDHELLARRLRGSQPRRTSTTAGKEVYQVSVESTPLVRVVEQLATRLSLEVTWDREAIDRAGISIEQRTSLKVDNADLDQLLRALFKGSGLTFERNDRSVVIKVGAK
jgi:hypothetical protein